MSTLGGRDIGVGRLEQERTDSQEGKYKSHSSSLVQCRLVTYMRLPFSLNRLDLFAVRLLLLGEHPGGLRTEPCLEVGPLWLDSVFRLNLAITSDVPEAIDQDS